jgi:hypothetical protein
MEGLIIGIVSNFGIPGIVFVIWWFNSRQTDKLMRQYREDTRQIADTAAASLSQMRELYERNADLVRRYIDLSGDLKEVVIMNTQAWQRCHDAINGNQFCPNVRLKKAAIGDQQG